MTDIVSLSDISEIVDCPHSTPKWTASGVPVIRNYNLNAGVIDQNDLSYTDEEGYKSRIKRAIPEGGDIVLSREAPMGTVGIVPDGFKCCLGQRLVLIKPNRQVCIPHYLNYAMQSQFVQNQIQVYNSSGTTVSNLKIPVIESIQIPLPSLDVQQNIVDTIKPFDDLIEIKKKINDYLIELCLIKLKRMQLLCNDYTTVNHYCIKIFSGGTPSTSYEEYWNGTIPWLSSGETRSKFIIDTEKKITQEGVVNSSTKKANRGDVVMASAGQGWTRGQTSFLLTDVYVNQSVLVMRPKDNCSAFLLFSLLNKYDEVRTWSDGSSSRGSMSGQLLKEFPIELFSNEMLSEFEVFCKPIIAMIGTNMRENHNLIEIRKALLSSSFQETDVAK